MLTSDDPPEEWDGWQISAINGGANNRVYRITQGNEDYAVKFAIRDARDRAGREYQTLRVLESVGAAIAPKPVMLDRRRYAQPVVICTWLDGAVSGAPPADDAEWQQLIAHFAAIHAIEPAHSPVRLRRAWLTAMSRAACRDLVEQEVARVPVSHQPAALRRLKDRWEGLKLPAWKRVPPRLCRVDPNILNMIRGADGWRSVDWENSGWSDPAFEIADLITHPSYMAVHAERWEWVIAQYISRMRDPSLEARIRAYQIAMLVWWCFRFNRYLYDVDHGRDQRLVARQAGWREDGIAKMERYLRLVEKTISSRV